MRSHALYFIKSHKTGFLIFYFIFMRRLSSFFDEALTDQHQEIKMKKFSLIIVTLLLVVNTMDARE